MMLQKRYWVFLLIISMSLIVGAIAIGIAQAAWNAKSVIAAESGEEMDRRTITVTGNGEVEVEPDVAYIHFGVTTKADTAEAAQQDNANLFAQVDKVLYESYGIAKEDVKTTGFNVRPEYWYTDKEPPKVTGYTATHTVQVTYRKLDEVGALLDALTKAGVNQMNQIQFGSEKLSDYEVDALKKAVAEARIKAEALAASERRALKGVLQITESAANANYGFSSVGIARDMAASEASTSISPGEIKIRKQVTVQYEF